MKVYIDKSSFNNIHTEGITGDGVIYMDTDPAKDQGTTYLKVTNSTFCANQNDDAVNVAADNQAAVIFVQDMPRVDIINCKFRNNTDSQGGAIYSDGSKVYVENTVFQNNRATMSGGAVYVRNVFTLATTAIDKTQEFVNCYFYENKATQGTLATINEGGAIYIGNGGNISVKSSHFINNQADDNGGSIRQNSNGDLTLTSNYFCNNFTSSGDGGAVDTNGGAQFMLSKNVFNGNHSYNDGGAIWLNGAATSLYADDNYFYGNYMGNAGNINSNGGGAIYILGETNILSFTNNKFDSNYATVSSTILGDGGGALYFDGVIGTTNDNITTFNGNEFRANKVNGNAGLANASGGSDVKAYYLTVATNPIKTLSHEVCKLKS